MTHAFSNLGEPHPDPIFTIALEARNAGPEAIDATAGVYMDEDGIPLIFESTKRALQTYGSTLHNQDISYPPLLGLPQYRSSVSSLIFGKDHTQCIASIATTGGTGALSINLKLVKKMHPDVHVILPTPAWANHMPVCNAAQVDVIQVPYVIDDTVSIESIVDALQSQSGSVAILIQAKCHNPTGRDLNDDQWSTLIHEMQNVNCTVILDIAYQGFADEPWDDVEIARRIEQAGIPLLITWSASKNHSIYGLRTGMACAVVPDAKTRAAVEGHYSMLSREMHSSAPTAGQWIVQLVQEHEHDQWLQDLKEVRTLLNEKRSILRDAVPAELQSALDGHGMFATLPLSTEQIDRLRTEHKVFMIADGRINIAGVPLRRMKEFGEKITQVYV